MKKLSTKQISSIMAATAIAAGGLYSVNTLNQSNQSSTTEHVKNHTTNKTKTNKKSLETSKNNKTVFADGLSASAPVDEIIDSAKDLVSSISETTNDLLNTEVPVKQIVTSNSTNYTTPFIKSTETISNSQNVNKLSFEKFNTKLEVTQPVVETKTEEVTQPVVETKTEEVTQPVVETKTEEIAQPVVETETEEVTQPVVETKTEEAIQPVVETKTEEVIQPVVETKTEEVIQPVVETKTEEATQPVVETKTEEATQPVVETKTEEATQPVVETKTEEATQPVVETTTEETVQPVIENNITYSPNTYPAGQCTWGVKQLAQWAGNYWGNANQWAASAQAAGFTVGSEPAVGSIAVWSGSYSNPFGHVAYVTEVQSQTNIQVLESNYAGNQSIANYRGQFNPTMTSDGSVQYIYAK